MEIQLITLSFQECGTRYGLTPDDLQAFLDLGLVQAAPAPGAVLVAEADDTLPRLARLHHDLGLPLETLDVVLAMRRRLVALQKALAHETARARQLEHFLGCGPLLDILAVVQRED